MALSRGTSLTFDGWNILRFFLFLERVKSQPKSAAISGEIPPPLGAGVIGPCMARIAPRTSITGSAILLARGNVPGPARVQGQVDAGVAGVEGCDRGLNRSLGASVNWFCNSRACGYENQDYFSHYFASLAQSISIFHG